MQYKYEENIPSTIAEAIVEIEKQNRVDGTYHNNIHRKVENLLGHRLSDRQFVKYLKKMTEEKLLERNDPTGKRGSKVFYSLANRAEKKYNLKILGSDEKVQKRKNLYQLLIFFEIFKIRNPVTERQLYRFLKQIGMSRNNLEITKEVNSSHPKVTHFKPIKDVQIIKWAQTDSKMNSDTATYYVVIPGFTVKEFTSYLKKLKKDKEPRPFSSYLGITDVPFALYTYYTESEVVDAIESFRSDSLIKAINDVFPGEMRYKIADESLISFIKDIWLVHDIDLRLLFERLVYDGKPKDDDRNYLTLLYGRKIVDRILSNAYHLRKSYKQQNNKQEQRIAKEFIQDLASYRTSLVQDIMKTHQKVIKEYEIASELIEGICSSPFIPKH